jgi:formylmethanofuran dehydrogenase subunit B
MKFTIKQLCEFDAKDFLEEETWKRYRRVVDEHNAFRKTIKGKPSLDQAIQLLCNEEDSVHYEWLLNHSARMEDKCICIKCMRKNTGFVDIPFVNKLQKVLNKYGSLIRQAC